MSLEQNPVSSARGAYGVKLLGLFRDRRLRAALVTPPEHWPAVSIERRDGEAATSGSAFVVEEDWARLELSHGCQAILDRRERRATLVTPEPLDPDELVHPALAYVASVFSHWLGRRAFHAGAFITKGGAWALLGMRRAGKSSTLGWLASAGHSILTDDMLVLQDSTAFAGPRAIDLAPSAARYLAVGAEAALVRAGRRQRIALEGIEAEVPLRGWIVLSWGNAVEAIRIPPGERLPLLAQHLHGHRPLNARALLELARAPAFELRRPKRLASLPDAGRAVLELTASCGA